MTNRWSIQSFHGQLISDIDVIIAVPHFVPPSHDFRLVFSWSFRRFWWPVTAWENLRCDRSSSSLNMTDSCVVRSGGSVRRRYGDRWFDKGWLFQCVIDMIVFGGVAGGPAQRQGSHPTDSFDGLHDDIQRVLGQVIPRIPLDHLSQFLLLFVS